MFEVISNLKTYQSKVPRRSRVTIPKSFRVAFDLKWVIGSATLSQVLKFNLLKRMQLQSWVECWSETFRRKYHWIKWMIPLFRQAKF